MQPTTFKVDSSVAHNLAIVINELTTNTLKHALKNRDSALLDISFTKENDENLGIRFADDGPGYPEEITKGDLSQANIGIEIVYGIITSTLQGKILFDNQGGAITTFTFKNNPNS